MPSPQLPEGIIVKDYDDRFKVLHEGELKELDEFLTSAETAPPAPPAKSIKELGFPKFTDLAPVPADSHFKEPEKAATFGEKSELHFHPEDQDEIRRELEKLNELFRLSPQKRYSIVKIADKLAEKHGLKLSSSEAKTFAKTLLSYFRQMRSLIETRAILVGSKSEGTMGLNAETCDHLLAVARQLKHKIEEADGIVLEEDAPQEAGPTKPSDTMQPVRESMPVQEPAMARSVSATASYVRTRPSISRITTGSDDAPKPPPKAVEAELQAAAPIEATVTGTRPPAVRSAHPSTARIPIVEIKRPHTRGLGHPMGRVEELLTMDLATWRLLDPDPRIRAGKILGKIQSLEHESFTRKSQGIEAWRTSDVYQHYLALGQMSLEKKKDVSEIIHDVEAGGQQTLTLDEFEAVSDLNRMLRF